MRKNTNKFLFAKLRVADILASYSGDLAKLHNAPERNENQRRLDEIAAECVMAVLEKLEEEL